MSILNSKFTRRDLFAGAGAFGALAAFGLPARASGSMMAAMYPGTWEEAYRSIVAPQLLADYGTEVLFDPLYAVDQVAKARAARGVPPFDTFVLDPGPAATAFEAGLFEPIDISRLSNAAFVPEGLITSHAVTAANQIVGICYNPTKFDAPPVNWADLLEEPFVSRLGLTGFGTTFGTVSLIEMAKAFGGSIENMDPIFEKLLEALPKVASVAAPQAMTGLFQQGEIDIMYGSTNTAAILKGLGVDIEFIHPASGSVAFQTTLHIAKDSENIEQAYQYIDTAISAAVQDQLQTAPYNMIPVNTQVALGDGLGIRSLDELAGMVSHDWSQINPRRAEWIERFNREITR